MMSESGESTIGVTIEEVITSTVRAMQNSEQRKLNQLEVAALLPEFRGISEDPNHWFRRVELIKNNYRLSEIDILLIVITKLQGPAREWYFSKPEYATYNYEVLKEEILKLFDCREDKITLMRKFEARKWKRNEKFVQYFHDKVILGNKVGLSEMDIVTYVIDGFDRAILQSQARMQCFTSLDQLLTTMNRLTEVDLLLNNRQPTLPGRAPVRPAVRQPTSVVPETTGVRCFNCYGLNHYASSCPKPRRERGSCFSCGSKEHRVTECPQRERTTPQVNAVDSTTHVMENENPVTQAYVLPISIKLENSNYINCNALLDSGCGVSLLKESLIPDNTILSKPPTNLYLNGINSSKLNILGSINTLVKLTDINIEIEFYVVPDTTMSTNCLLGRNVLAHPDLEFVFRNNTVVVKKVAEISHSDFLNNDVLLITSEPSDESLDIEQTLEPSVKMNVYNLYQNCYLLPARPEKPIVKFEMNIHLKNKQPFYFRPRKLSYSDQLEVRKIVDNLLIEGVIRKSNSEYSSPIVLVRKKRDKASTRMCVDYRELNKITIKDRFPLPLIDDQLIKLRDKSYFTKLDLKNGFHHIKVNENSIKYTAFVTPFGQFEYVKMPFGLCNGPSTFMRFINEVFSELIYTNKIIIYLDDILIATKTLEENLDILCLVFKVMVNNCLELRLDKCSFLKRKTNYLGYIVGYNQLSPNPDNIRAVLDYPVPQNAKQLHSFLGLVSYFRRFIKDFSLLSKPLFNLIKKTSKFCFDEEAITTFEKLKLILSQEPVLCIYSPHSETELHCDASSIGFGSILLQRQSDDRFHPIFFFSRRTTEAESRYHSFELETLAIIYSLERFRTYLLGLKFKIVTDCNSLKQTLEKQNINPRIARWSLALQEYDYVLEHRTNSRMKHVDALSRCTNILVLEENTFAQTLSIKQTEDVIIKDIKNQLQVGDIPHYELRHGLVYRKEKNSKLLFYVPQCMEDSVIRNNHDDLGHQGVDKTLEYIRRIYWFPNMKDKIRNYIKQCLKCIVYNPISGKTEGELHCIPKGKLPFQCLHIDHFGPLEKTKQYNRHILLIIDAFTKFVKFYACRSTTTDEVIKHLKIYFSYYSKPKTIISDRGSAFTSMKYKEFLNSLSIEPIWVATACPRANGQVERINRSLGPMLAKLSPAPDKWDTVLSNLEFAFNNSINRAIKDTPSRLLFGINQIGIISDNLREVLDIDEGRDLNEIRDKASDNINHLNIINKRYYDIKHKKPTKYSIGDYILIRNFDSTPGVSKKLIPRYRGPYVVNKVLENDRYIVTDIEDNQLAQIPYTGTVASDNMKLWSRHLD